MPMTRLLALGVLQSPEGQWHNTKPFTLKIARRIVADGSEPIEFICHENQMFLKLTGRASR